MAVFWEDYWVLFSNVHVSLFQSASEADEIVLQDRTETLKAAV